MTRSGCVCGPQWTIRCPTAGSTSVEDLLPFLIAHHHQRPDPPSHLAAAQANDFVGEDLPFHRTGFEEVCLHSILPPSHPDHAALAEIGRCARSRPRRERFLASGSSSHKAQRQRRVTPQCAHRRSCQLVECKWKNKRRHGATGNDQSDDYEGPPRIDLAQ